MWLIRHGETEWNRERRCQGISDIELNGAGRKQAMAVASRFAGAPLDAVHASPLKRALQTAKAVADPAGLDVSLEPGLMELDQGDFEGRKMNEMANMRPDIIKQWIQNPADTIIPGGESMRQLQERAWKSIETIVNAYPREARVAAVCHNLTLGAVMCKILEMDLNLFRKFRLSPGGISIVDFTALGPVLVTLNDTSHCNSAPSETIS